MGSSAGLRLRHVQPTGYMELNGKSTDYLRSAWVGAATVDFSDIDVAGFDGQLAERLGWASRKVELPAGRYETVLPPSAVADLMIYLYWSAGARDAHDGRSVFSKSGGGTRVGGESDCGLRGQPGSRHAASGRKNDRQAAPSRGEKDPFRRLAARAGSYLSCHCRKLNPGSK